MGYTKKWYDKNKEALSKKRSDRYKNDPEYRKKTKEASKKYRDRKRLEKESDQGPLVISIQGQDHPAMTLEEIETKTGITPARIKYMQSSGYIPQALVNRPNRVYTQNQVKLITDMENFLRANGFHLRGLESDKRTAIRQELNALISTIVNEWDN